MNSSSDSKVNASSNKIYDEAVFFNFKAEQQQGKKAYLHIMGLGLKVWMLDPRQKN